MNFRLAPFLAGLIFIASLSIVGCSLFNPTGSDLTDLKSNSGINSGNSGSADVKFNILLPPTRTRGSILLPVMRYSAESEKAKVTFKLVIGNPRNREHSSDTIQKTVDVTDGTAEVTFDSIPAKPVVGTVKIDRGHLHGYSDFIGASDLAPGSNTVTLVPAGSNMKEEIVAKVVQTTLLNDDLNSKAPDKLVGSVETAVSQVDITKGTAFNDAFSKFIEHVKPPTYVYFTEGYTGEVLSGYKGAMKIWTRKESYFNIGELWSTDLTQMRLHRVLRQGLEGFGFVSFRHSNLSPFGIVRVDTASGTRTGYVANPGICDQIIVLNDGSIIAGGTNDDLRCPVLFRWSGKDEALTRSNSQSEKGLQWARYFENFPATTNYPHPAVESLTYDGQILLCTIWDAKNERQRTFRIDINTGTGDAGFIGAITNSLPFVNIDSPSNGTTFIASSNVSITAQAFDTDGIITKVEFYHDVNKLAEVATAPYFYKWETIQPGSYTVFAKAYDDKGGETVSKSCIFEAIAKPEANTIGTPSVSISSPVAGQITEPNPRIIINVTNSGENHISTDWEIYSSSDMYPANLVWAKSDDTISKTEITVNEINGTFQNTLVGKSALNHLTAYWVRARARNSVDDSLMGEWSSAVLFSIGAPPRLFIRNSDGVITDSKTGLQWLEGADQATDWNQAQSWIKNLGNGWRTPSIQELKEIYLPGTARKGGSSGSEGPWLIHQDTAFTVDSAYWIWSVASDTSTATGFDFVNGASAIVPKNTASWHIRARAVRSAPAKTLSGLSLTPENATIVVNETFNLEEIRVTAAYSDNSSKVITLGKWNGNGVSLATFTASPTTGEVLLSYIYTESEITKVATFTVNVVASTTLRFSRANDGVITDSETGLQWLEGPDNAMSADMAAAWIKSLGNNWRTPNSSELLGIYLPDSTRMGAPIGTNVPEPLRLDPVFQLNTSYNVYFGGIRGTSFFSFKNGYDGIVMLYSYEKSLRNRAFAVRPNVIPSKRLSSLSLTPASFTVDIGGVIDLSKVNVKAIYDDNSSSNILSGVTWNGVGITQTTFAAPATSSEIFLTCSYTEGEITKIATLPVNVVADYTSSNIGVLKFIPAGSFQRDSIPGNISYVSAFRMARTEVTRGQFLSIMGEDPTTVTYNGMVISTGLSDPVRNVSWYSAIAFCNKLSINEGLTPAYAVKGIDFAKLTYASIPAEDNVDWNNTICDWSAKGYRLPTEMEWMWAAMGGSKSPGVVNTTGYAKPFAGSDGTNSIVDYVHYITSSNDLSYPVGQMRPNEFGLYDMSGNAWEWCWDKPLTDSFPGFGLTGTISDYRGENSSLNSRINRGGAGGCYNNTNDTTLAVAFRSSDNPYSNYGGKGFRVVRP